MDAALTRQVWQRARYRYEYGQMLQECAENTFEIDHILAIKHGGATVTENLSLSCFHCNSCKGSNIAGRDAKTRKLAPLFNPRRHKWSRHFRWRGAYLIDPSPIGRVTIAILDINDPQRVELREELIEEGIFPPPA